MVRTAKSAPYLGNVGLGICEKYISLVEVRIIGIEKRSHYFDQIAALNKVDLCFVSGCHFLGFDFVFIDFVRGQDAESRMGLGTVV